MISLIKNNVLKLMFIIGGFLFVAMAVITFIHAVGRYLFNMPITGNTEIVTYLQFAGVSLLLPYAALQGCHVKIDLILVRLSRKVQAFLNIITHVIMLIFAALSGYRAFTQGSLLFKQMRATSVLKIPTFPFYYLLGVCWILTSLALIFLIVDFLCELIGKGGEKES